MVTKQAKKAPKEMLYKSIIRDIDSIRIDRMRKGLEKAEVALEVDNFPGRQEIIDALIKKVTETTEAPFFSEVKYGVGGQALMVLSKAKEPRVDAFLYSLADELQTDLHGYRIGYNALMHLIERKKDSPKDNEKIADILVNVIKTDDSTFSGPKDLAIELLPYVVDKLSAQKKGMIVDLLINIVETDDPVFGSQARAVRALGKIGDKKAVPALIKLIERPAMVMDMPRLMFDFPKNREMNCALDAATALGEIGDARALPILKKINDNKFVFAPHVFRDAYSTILEKTGKKEIKGVRPKKL